MLQSLSIVCLLLLGTISSAVAQEAKGSFSASVKAGGKSFDITGAGSCRHTPTASIYDVPAALWLVEYPGSKDGGIRRLHLTLWRPEDGSPEQFSLAVTTRS